MRIHHPNPQVGEATASGLIFVDGIAEIDSFGDDDIRPILELHGFRFEETAPTPEELAEAARRETEAAAAAEAAARKQAEDEAANAASAKKQGK